MNIPIHPLDEQAQQAARARQARLTKPAGALGQLEAIAIALAGVQGRVCPEIARPWISVFAADHGVVAEGVSAFPQAVTAQMMLNFLSGGAAISVLARHVGASLEVVDVGVAAELAQAKGLINAKVASGTANLAHTAAMTSDQLRQALQVGEQAVQRAQAAGADLFIGGEMGIGNTTAATAVIAALTGASAAEIVGAGTGVDEAGRARKAAVIERALARLDKEADAMTAMQEVGGLELAALMGAYLACGQVGLPVVVDGVIAAAAALAACCVAPELKGWLLWGHRSEEPAQQAVFAALSVRPLLDLEMRLGEGSGAAMAVPVIQLACRLHGEMATFDEAGVSDAH